MEIDKHNTQMDKILKDAHDKDMREMHGGATAM